MGRNSVSGTKFGWALEVRVGRHPSSIEIVVPQKPSRFVMEGPWRRLEAVGDQADTSLCISSLKGKLDVGGAHVRPADIPMERRNSRTSTRRRSRRDARKKSMQESGEREGEGWEGRGEVLRMGKRAAPRGGVGGDEQRGKQRKGMGSAGGSRREGSDNDGGELPGVWN